MSNKIVIVGNDYIDKEYIKSLLKEIYIVYGDDVERLYEKYNKSISLSMIQTIYNIIRDYDKCIDYIDKYLEIHKLYTSISEMDMINALNLTKVKNINYLAEYFNEVLLDLNYKEYVPNSKKWRIENKNKFHK